MKEGTNWGFSNLVYTLVALTGLVFVFLTYRALVLNNKHGSHYLLLHLSVVVPEIIVWAIATISAIRFKNYAHSISGSKDGMSLNFIANALLLMVLYIILLTMAGTIDSMLVHSPHLHTAVVLGNHIPLLAALSSSVLIFTGSKKLSELNNPKKTWLSKYLLHFLLIYAVFSVIFLWYFYKAVPNIPADNGVPRFASSPKFLIFTYGLPHLLIWLFGLLACINIAQFSLNTPGKIYKNLFQNLYKGILLIFICTYLAQLLVISTDTLDKFSLNLVLIYAVLVLSILGFILVYKGSERLSRLEKALP